MKHQNIVSSSFLLLVCFLFNACVGEDFVDDFIEPSLRINNPITSLQLSTTHSYQATYLNNIGQAELTPISWSSSDESIATVDDTGLVTATAEGSVTISATVTNDSSTAVDDDSFIIVLEEVENNEEVSGPKSGVIQTTSSYALKGDFTIEENGADLLLSISANYEASSSLPGLYVYLTNNPSSANGAVEIGKVTTFNGAHSYTINNVDIDTYTYLLYWCKPFGVKVGEGKIE